MQEANGGLIHQCFGLPLKIEDPSLLWVERNYLNKNPQTHINNRLLPAINFMGQ
jgi:hypothetical protein